MQNPWITTYPGQIAEDKGVSPCDGGVNRIKVNGGVTHLTKLFLIKRTTTSSKRVCSGRVRSLENKSL